MAGYAKEITRHDQQRRLGHRRGRRPRHPRRGPSRPRLLHAPRRDDRAEVRRQVRARAPTRPPAVCTAWASPWSTSSPSGARSRSAATATSISRSTSGACPPADVRRIGSTDRRGTKTTFKPDPLIFPDTDVRLQHPLPPLAGAGLPQPRREDRLQGPRGPARARRSSTSGASSSSSSYLNRASEPVHPDVIYIAGEVPSGVELEVAMQYSGEYTENVHSYVNNINTIEGGTHLSGFRTALTRTLNDYGKKEGIFKDLVPTRRRLPRGPDGRHLAPRARAAVRRPDQDQARQQRDRRHRQLGGGRLPGQLPRREPQDRQDHRPKGPAGRRGPRERPQGPGARPRAQGRPGRRRPARQAPRLHQPRRRPLRAVPGRGRFGRRQRRGRPHPRVPGHPPPARQDHQRLQVARRQGAGQRRGPQHDLGHRLGHRRGSRPHQAPLRQDHHHDRRRRRRLAHPHAAADLLLPADVRPGQAAGTSTWPSRRCSACGTRRRPTTCRPKRR